MDYELSAAYTGPQTGMPVARPHSGLGIASFIISIPVGVLLFILFVIAGVLETTTPGGLDEESPMAVIIGLCLIGLVGLDVIAFGLGIAGLCQGDHKKLFAVLGVLFSALAVVSMILLVIIGTMVA